MDLTAALNDPAGIDLVEGILERKKARNLRDRFFEQMVWGEVRTDGHGNVIPRPVPDYWASLDAALEKARARKITYTQKLNALPVLSIDPADGSEPTVMWVDEHLNLMTHARGHGKTALARRWLERREIGALLTDHRPAPAPDIRSVRWECLSPTAKVHTGKNGVLVERSHAYFKPAEWEHNRKLNQRYVDAVDMVHQILGLGKHDSDNS